VSVAEVASIDPPTSPSVRPLGTRSVAPVIEIAPICASRKPNATGLPIVSVEPCGFAASKRPPPGSSSASAVLA